MNGRPNLFDVFRRLLRAFRSPGVSLGQRVAHGGLWTLTSKVATRSVSFVRTMVLARLLAPEDFGLFGIALLTQATLNTLFSVGIDSALIQRPTDTDQYLDTAFTIKVVKATLVAGGLLLSAPYVAAFFGEPAATPLIQVLAAVVLAQGLENVGAIYFRKELEFRKQFALDFTGTAFNALVAIPAAVILGSVWALMAGILAGALTRLGLTYLMHPFRPTLEFRWHRIADILNFGKWIFGSSTLGFASTQGDDILLGRWLGAPALGVYRIAYQISNAVATEVTHLISGVTFPAYSKLQTDGERLREAFLSTLSVTATVVVPLTAAIVVFIPDFVDLVIGEQWIEVVGPVRVLALAGLLRAISACWGPLYLARARTEKPFWKQLARTILTLGPAYPLTLAYGIEGMALCVLAGISGALAFDLWWAWSWREVPVGLRSVIDALMSPTLCTAMAVAPVLLLYPEQGMSLFQFAALGGLYGATYVVAIIFLESLGRDTAIRKVMRLLEQV